MVRDQWAFKAMKVSFKMTVKELHKFLGKLMKEGREDAAIYFDTNAQHFEYHMAKVGSAYFEADEDTGLGDFVYLIEEK